jgi:CDGSH-type Zn-finger protein
MGFQNSPYLKDETTGKRAWCACGQTENEPYCDGSHSRKNTGMTPVVVEIMEEKTVAWCGCRRSGNKPFCDGSHSRP